MSIGDLVKFANEPDFHNIDTVGVVVNVKCTGGGKLNLITILYDGGLWCYPEEMLAQIT